MVDDFLDDLRKTGDPVIVPDYYLAAGHNHFSPSQVNLPLDVWLHNYVFRDQDWRRTAKIPNPNMTAGNATQGFYNKKTKESSGLSSYVFTGASKEHASQSGIESYKKNKVLYAGGELDRFNKNLEVMGACINNGIRALDEIDIRKEKDLTTELYCEHFFPGIEITTIGRTDLMATSKYLVELKTKWHTKKLQKGYIPKGEPDFNYLCQVAFYWKATGLEPILIYHTGMPVVDRKTKKTNNEYKIFSKENCEQLTPAAMEEYLEHCRAVLTVRQNLLKISSDPKVLAQHVQPDFNSFYWNDLNEEQLREAKELWGM